jgi:2-polyprenyl-6-methoxyphenol hydroxylase-like FAD-dependent oxidoreductase
MYHNVKSILIVGGGTSGWMTAAAIAKRLPHIKLSLVESPDVPVIGVGESTTLNFLTRVLPEIDLEKFVQESDAAVKYGVYYKNWSKKDFIHYFKSEKEFCRKNYDEISYGQLLSNKDKNIHIHDLIGNKLWKFIQENEVSLDFKEHKHSWHFDAGKFIKFF